MSTEWKSYWSLEGNKLYFMQNPEKKAKQNKHEVRLTDAGGMTVSNESIKKTFYTLQENAALHAAKYWREGHLALRISPETKGSLKIILQPLAGESIGVKPQIEKRRLHPKFEASDVIAPTPIKAGKRIGHAEGPAVGERPSHIISQQERSKIIKLVLENKLKHDPAQPLTYLDKKEHHLTYSVIVGKEGQLIAIYEKGVLGNGLYGVVCLGMDIVTGQPYAVKRPLKAESQENAVEEKALRAMGQFVDKQQLDANGTSHIQELAWGMDLRVLQRDPTIPDSKKVHILNLVLQKMEELHRQGFLHRDIKPENIMYDPEDGVRLVDFGLSTEMYEGVGENRIKFGTPLFLPVEIWTADKEKARYTPKTDVYSTGVVAAVMLHRPSWLEIVNDALAVFEKRYLSADLKTGLKNKLLEAAPDVCIAELKENSDKYKKYFVGDDAKKEEMLQSLVNDLTRSLQLSPYDLFDHSVFRAYRNIKNISKLPSIVRKVLPDIFGNDASCDPLRTALNKSIALMCQDNPVDRPSVKEIATIIDLIDKEYQRRDSGALGPQEVSFGFEESISQMHHTFKELRDLYTKSRVSLHKDRPDSKFLIFSNGEDYKNFFDRATRAGFKQSKGATLGKCDWRVSQNPNIIAVEISSAFYASLV